MTKKMLKDILPKNGGMTTKSIQRFANSEDEIIYHKITNPGVDYHNNGIGKKSSRKFLWGLVLLVVFGLVSLFIYFTAGTKLIVVPRSYESDLDLELNAFNIDQKEISDVDLPYKKLTLSKIGGMDVVADGERMVDRKTSGTIIIYNNYSTNPQRLIKNTRFEAPNGLIYRINQSVVVPGQKTVNGQLVPGSVSAVVYADEPGEKYNIGPTDFTIPGLKSDSKRYAGFYAKSPDGLSGGYSGMIKYVSDENQKKVRENIRSSLEKEILIEAGQVILNGYFMPKNSYVVEFESLPVEEKGNNVAIKEKATLNIFTFDINKWDHKLAVNSIRDDVGVAEVYVKNRNELDFTWLERPKDDSSVLSFKVSGSALFIWSIDSTKLKEAVLGIKKSDLDIVTSNFPSIKKSKAIISPIWKTKFPTKPEDIDLVVELPEAYTN